MSIRPNHLALAVIYLLSLSVHAGSENFSGKLPDNVAIEGYSPVSYFEKGVAERGLSRHAVIHEGKSYYMTSAQQADKFRQNPDKYKPRFDVCPYSLTLGRVVSIDPTRFKIVAGRLLLFHKSEELDALKEWNEHGNDRALLEKAEQKYQAIDENIIDFKFD